MTDEAASRSAISRAYYSAYHTGCAFLEKLNFSVPQSGKGHAKAHNRLQGSKEHDLYKAGINLKNLYGERITADYNLNDTKFRNQEHVEKLLDKAEEIIRLLEQDYSSKVSQISKAISECIALHEGR